MKKKGSLGNLSKFSKVKQVTSSQPCIQFRFFECKSCVDNHCLSKEIRNHSLTYAILSCCSCLQDDFLSFRSSRCYIWLDWYISYLILLSSRMCASIWPPIPLDRFQDALLDSRPCWSRPRVKLSYLCPLVWTLSLCGPCTPALCLAWSICYCLSNDSDSQHPNLLPVSIDNCYTFFIIAY